MAQIKRFGFGLQAMMLLAEKDMPMTSSEIAEQLQCEPTALRKILAQLADAKLLEVRQGRSGGYKLNERPESIPLIQVYLAMKDDEAEWGGIMDTVNGRAAGKKVQATFYQILTDINTQLEHVLGTYTIADLID